MRLTVLLRSVFWATSFALGVFLSLGAYASENALRSSGVQLGFVLLPGAQKKPMDYEGIAKHIALHVGELRPDIGLYQTSVSFPGNFPNPVQMNGKIAEGIAELERNGFENRGNNLFVIAHSMAGIFASQALANEQERSRVAGLILLGSYLPSTFFTDEVLEDYRIPVLTLAGEHDGLTRFTRIDREFRRFETLVQNKDLEYALRTVPVVIVPEANHSQMSSGEMQEGDIESPLPLESAQSAYANAMVSFALATSGFMADDAALYRLQTMLEGSLEILHSWRMSRMADQEICDSYQRLSLGEDPFLRERPIEAEFFADGFAFARSKPALIDPASGALAISWNMRSPSNLADLSTIPESPHTLSCKTKSAAAVLEQEGLEDGLSCAGMNRRIIKSSLQLLSGSERARFEDSGWTFEFAPDERHFTGVTWISSRLRAKLDRERKVVTLTSSRLQTAPDFFVPNLAGMNYCHLLPPSRVVEFARVDALKPEPGN